MASERIIRGSAREYAKILARALPIETVADILNGLLCIEPDPNYRDREWQLASVLFNALSDEMPEAADLATKR